MGASKRIFESELIERKIKFNKIIKKIINILPYDYNFEVIENYIKKFYFFDYKELCDFKEYYDKKNKFLIKIKKKSRYEMPEISFLLKNLPIVKCLLKKETKEKYQKNYCESESKKLYSQFEKERENKNKKRYEKLSKAQELVQQVEPEFLDKLMGIYFRKNTSQENRMYLFSEVEKYYCQKTVDFFRKVHDTEYNNQLRERAFLRLQEWGHYIRLRKGKYIVIKTKNKKRREFIKKIYKNQLTSLKCTPKELEKRIEESLDQRIKSYDYFISHSSKNSSLVKEIKEIFNADNKNIYCDWISDNHYLKRTLISEATKIVINKRMEQSKELIFVDTPEARNSLWVKYELNYFYNLKKKMYVWNEKINSTEPMKDYWYVDNDYKNMKLF